MSDEINPPEAPIEPIRTEWTLYTSSETTTEPWVFSLTLTAPYVTPTQAEIVDAVIDGVFAATGIRLQKPAPAYTLTDVDGVILVRPTEQDPGGPIEPI
jgi:hypothetical protein